MSAFIVSDKTINRIVTFMSRQDGNDELDFGSLKSPLTEAFSKKAFSKIAYAERLLAMNVEAVKHRYGDRAQDMLPDEPYQFAHVKASPTQVLKSIACLLYQCSEGDVPACEEFKRLHEYEQDLAGCIATSTPEYAAAEWG